MQKKNLSCKFVNTRNCFTNHERGTMKKLILKNQLVTLLMSACACFTTVNAMAQDVKAPANPSADVKDSECSKELLLAYFPEIFVRETFTKFNVPKDKWDSIVKGLNDKDKDVIRVVEDRASKMTPNPLKDPEQRQAAVKLFRETLLEIFSGVLKDNGISDDAQISAMLDDIQQQKAKRFALCIKKDYEAHKSDAKSPSSDDFDDEDDEDDYDDDEDEDKPSDQKTDNKDKK